MPRSRYKIFQTHNPYFLSCTIVGWLPVFTRAPCVQQILDSLTFLQANKRITLYGYVILENHMHMIAAAPNLADEIAKFKSYTARCIIDWLVERGEDDLIWQMRNAKAEHKTDRPNQLWHEGSHPAMIQSDEMMVQRLEYTHMNPVKRGYVDDPVHWRYSSARNYMGLPGLIPVTVDWRNG